MKYMGFEMHGALGRNRNDQRLDRRGPYWFRRYLENDKDVVSEAYSCADNRNHMERKSLLAVSSRFKVLHEYTNHAGLLHWPSS